MENNQKIAEEVAEQCLHRDVRSDPFFLSVSDHEHFLTHGWCRLNNVISQDEIESFMEAFNAITHCEGFELTEQFLNTGCLHNPRIRSLTQEAIDRNVQTILPRMFDMDKVDFRTGGAFVVKPAHENSSLAAHQDSSFIDEEKDYSLFMWIPFCDVTLENGPIRVLSGSHLWGNTQRGFSVPWNLSRHVPLLERHMVPVTANAGDVLIFDPALVHGSSTNLSTRTRHAITITVVRKNPRLIYFYKDSAMPLDIIERFHVDETFFREYDFASRPDSTRFTSEFVEYRPFDLTEDELEELIWKFHP